MRGGAHGTNAVLRADAMAGLAKAFHEILFRPSHKGSMRQFDLCRLPNQSLLKDLRCCAATAGFFRDRLDPGLRFGPEFLPAAVRCISDARERSQDLEAGSDLW